MCEQNEKRVLAPDHRITLLAGASAGLCVDLAVYPLDTLKTRLQSVSHSIVMSGRLYLFAGIPVVLLGSAPTAAIFFASYEIIKSNAQKVGAPGWVSAAMAASLGDAIACVTRVPVETIKQRAQSRPLVPIITILREIHQVENFFEHYNYVKRSEASGLTQQPTESSGLLKSQFAFCGAVAGATAGFLTTPMDVAKTRIMLANRTSTLASGNVITALKRIYSEGGLKGLFAGVAPRVVQVSIGGAIFLGLYDITKQMWSDLLHC